MLRTDFSVGRPGRSGAQRTGPAGRDLRAVCSTRRADRRAGAELPADLARRTAVAALRQRRQGRQCARAAVRGISGARGGGRAIATCRSAPVAGQAVVHGHCHQKSFGAFKPVEQALRLIPDLDSRDDRVRAAAAWPALSAMAPTPIRHRSRWPNCHCCRRCATPTTRRDRVADGTSCRHQIKDGASA